MRLRINAKPEHCLTKTPHRQGCEGLGFSALGVGAGGFAICASVNTELAKSNRRSA